ncbi:NTP transferase domain-containing protein [Aliifodinibius salicampi]|uniref:NTP transferase domain-containing protein n=1 Tax=Fodinibius salicampi TaxID=1920655 RepID=A0ABT3Q219_9BACT|nr:NTP transferase domain-containing protein [Fodinibius salicampi]MCW9714126.1 NTP transferase domain-containing protein [Fodinibius salicampi]
MPKNKNGQPHQKHTSLAKAHDGTFGRNELSIVGTTCTAIKKFANQLSKQLSQKYQLGYIDAEHWDKNSSDRDSSETYPDTDLVHIQTESVQKFNFKKRLNNYQVKSIFNEVDLILLNGNHFKVQNRITVIDPRKPVKPEDLANTKLIVLQEGLTRIPDYVKKNIKEMDQVPVFKIGDTAKIASNIEQLLEGAISPLKGLVLAGGKSTRMHTDKTKLDYHGKPQRVHLYELLDDYCDEVFLSCRKEQQSDIPEGYNIITDSFLDMGPMGALLSAFKQHPDSAFLTVACDLPLLTSKTLESLKENQNPSKIATAFKNNESGFPEPLITIWEPKSYQVLLTFLGMGHSCPRKALINADVQLLDPPDSQELMNANNPGEYEQALAKLSTR